VIASPRIRTYDHVLLDLDGCVWVGDEACAGAVDAVAALRDGGASVLFLTNDVRHAPEDFVRKLWRLGFQASPGEVVTVGSAVQFLLSGRDRGTAFVVGSQALVDHVAEAGLRIVNRTPFATRADVVVVGAHHGFGYDELRIAAQAVLRGAELVGATRDATFPMPDGPWPGTGAVLAAIEAAAGRRADLVVGKPEPLLFREAASSVGMEVEEAVVIGDGLRTDIAAAHRVGARSVLMLTGVTTRAHVEAASDDERATAVAADAAELEHVLEQLRADAR
jgi:HAD superfamily hydrolase (TIGR01450 family)